MGCSRPGSACQYLPRFLVPVRKEPRCYNHRLDGCDDVTQAGEVATHFSGNSPELVLSLRRAVPGAWRNLRGNRVCGRRQVILLTRVSMIGAFGIIRRSLVRSDITVLPRIYPQC
jgi:hypothetical protein